LRQVNPTSTISQALQDFGHPPTDFQAIPGVLISINVTSRAWCFDESIA
jgi:hypothetical protein